MTQPTDNWGPEMKNKILFLALASLFAAALAPAQIVKRQASIPLVRAEFAGCSTANEGFLKVIVDASSKIDCDTTPEEDPESWVKALCICRDGSLELAYDAVDTALFVLLFGDSNGQSIQGRTGGDEARIDLGETAAADAYLYGAGASPARLRASTAVAEAISPNGLSKVTVGNDNVTVASSAGFVTLAGVRWGASAAAAPYQCSGSPVGYFTDTDGPDLCYCNGTSWAPVDGVGTCTDPE